MRICAVGQGDATVDGTHASCGVSALWGMQGYEPAALVAQVLTERLGMDKSIREAFVVFSDVDYDHRGGYALAKYIRENNLGTIIESETRMNPNTGNRIKVWVWSPPHESLDPHHRHLPRVGYKRVFAKVDKRFLRYAPQTEHRLDAGEYFV